MDMVEDGMESVVSTAGTATIALLTHLLPLSPHRAPLRGGSEHSSSAMLVH